MSFLYNIVTDVQAKAILDFNPLPDLDSSVATEVMDARAIHGFWAQKPDFVVTDKLGAYNHAFNREFYTNKKPQTKHVRLKNIREGTNNNIVERLHGTLRERTKVMRGLDHDESAQMLIDGKRFYYNFIRPHQALNGKTPAEAAGINLNLGDNKWDGFIKKASSVKLS